MKKTIEEVLGRVVWKGMVGGRHTRIVAEGDNLSVIMYEYEIYKRKVEPTNSWIIYKAKELSKELNMKLKVPKPIYEISNVKNVEELEKLKGEVIKTGELQNPRPFYIDKEHNKYELCIRSEEHTPYSFVLDGRAGFELPKEAEEVVKPYVNQYLEFERKDIERRKEKRREELLKEAKELGLL